MKDKTIDSKDFFKMFIAISYSSEQVFFNFVDLTGYLFGRYVIDEDVYDELEETLIEMINDGKITLVEGCTNLYQINRSFDFIKTIKDNHDYLDEMIRFFKCYYDRSNKKAKIRIVAKDIQILK